MYLLDTNTVIYYFKGVGRVKERLLAQGPKTVIISSMVQYELEHGILKIADPSKRKSLLESFYSVCGYCHFGPAEARAAAQIRHDLEKKGKSILIPKKSIGG